MITFVTEILPFIMHTAFYGLMGLAAITAVVTLIGLDWKLHD